MPTVGIKYLTQLFNAVLLLNYFRGALLSSLLQVNVYVHTVC
jgi:hypothetical protein